MTKRVPKAKPAAELPVVPQTQLAIAPPVQSIGKQLSFEQVAANNELVLEMSMVSKKMLVHLGETVDMAASNVKSHDAIYATAGPQFQTELQDIKALQETKIANLGCKVKGLSLMLQNVLAFASLFKTKPGEFEQALRYAPRCLPIKADNGARQAGTNLRSPAKVTESICNFELTIDPMAEFSRSTIARVYVATSSMDGFEMSKTGPLIKNGWVEFLPSIAAVRHTKFTRLIYFMTPVFKYTSGKTSTPMMLLPPPTMLLRNELFSTVDMPTCLHDESENKLEKLQEWRMGENGPTKQFSILLRLYTAHAMSTSFSKDDEEAKLFDKKLYMVAVPCVGRVVDMQAAFLTLLLGKDKISELHRKDWEVTMPLEMLAAAAYMMINVNMAIHADEATTVNMIVSESMPSLMNGDDVEMDDVDALTEEWCKSMVPDLAVFHRDVKMGLYPLFNDTTKLGASSVFLEQLASSLNDFGVVASKMLKRQGFELDGQRYMLRNYEQITKDLFETLTPGSTDHAKFKNCLDQFHSATTTRDLVINQRDVAVRAAELTQTYVEEQAKLKREIDALRKQSIVDHEISLREKKSDKLEVGKLNVQLVEVTTKLQTLDQEKLDLERDGKMWQVLMKVINECGGAALQGGHMIKPYDAAHGAMKDFALAIESAVDGNGDDLNLAVGDVLKGGFPQLLQTLFETGQDTGLNARFTETVDGFTKTEAESVMELCVNPAEFLDNCWEHAMEKHSLPTTQRVKYLTEFCKDKLHVPDTIVAKLVKDPRSDILDYFGSDPNKRPSPKRKADDDNDNDMNPSKRARK